MGLGEIWFVLIGVLIVGYAIFDGFDLGVGMLYPFLGKSEEDKATMRLAVGPVWDGNEVWLLTAGGAMFAAFAPVYATVFSGFYLAMMLLLFALIFRAASLEFRSVDPQWLKLWDASFFGGSAVASLLFGVATGNIVRGIPIDTSGEFAGNFFTLLNPYSVLMGVFAVCWFLLQGSSWLSVKTTGPLLERSKKVRKGSLIATAVMLAVMTAATALLVPRAFNATVAAPLGWGFIVLAIASLVWAWVAAARGTDLQAFYASSLAALTWVGIWAVSIFPALVPAVQETGWIAGAATDAPDRALTIANSQGSQLTLTVMLIIAAIGVPLVLFYFALIYKTYAGRIEAADIKQSAHY